VDRRTLDPLADAIRQLEPHLVVVSGDFTQDARHSEFEQARDFLQSLPRPHLVVPGNHDMPFFNIVRRFIEGLARYKKYITEDLNPVYEDDEIVAVGVNTARKRSLRGGSIQSEDVAWVEQQTCRLPAPRTRILVTHHPFDLPERYPRRELVRRARLAMDQLAGCIDILLAGHMHLSYSGRTAERYRSHRKSAIFVQAGTATSTRGRGEPNAFNLLRVEGPQVEIDRFQWHTEHHLFAVATTERFVRGSEGWERAPKFGRVPEPEEALVVE
jgi:3',5'-cyclic AMP phosphodiesterase CpdA